MLDILIDLKSKKKKAGKKKNVNRQLVAYEAREPWDQGQGILTLSVIMIA